MLSVLKQWLQKLASSLRKQRRHVHITEYNGQWTYAERMGEQKTWHAGKTSASTPEGAIAAARMQELALFDTRLELLQDLVDRHVSQIFQEEDARDASDLDEADCHELLSLEWIDIQP